MVVDLIMGFADLMTPSSPTENDNNIEKMVSELT
jgi:hypothetical protein